MIFQRVISELLSVVKPPRKGSEWQLETCRDTAAERQTVDVRGHTQVRHAASRLTNFEASKVSWSSTGRHRTTAGCDVVVRFPEVDCLWTVQAPNQFQTVNDAE